MIDFAYLPLDEAKNGRKIYLSLDVCLFLSNAFYLNIFSLP